MRQNSVVTLLISAAAAIREIPLDDAEQSHDFVQSSVSWPATNPLEYTQDESINADWKYEADPSSCSVTDLDPAPYAWWRASFP